MYGDIETRCIETCRRGISRRAISRQTCTWQPATSRHIKTHQDKTHDGTSRHIKAHQGTSRHIKTLFHMAASYINTHHDTSRHITTHHDRDPRDRRACAKRQTCIRQKTHTMRTRAVLKHVEGQWHWQQEAGVVATAGNVLLQNHHAMSCCQHHAMSCCTATTLALYLARHVARRVARHVARHVARPAARQESWAGGARQQRALARCRRAPTGLDQRHKECVNRSWDDTPLSIV